MDPRLSKAARLGDVAALSAILEEDPLILENIALLSYVDTPLHIAALANRTDFAIHILSLKPSFARQPNKDGFTPLHIASANGNVELVKELLKQRTDLCFLKDRDGQTPLHLAAARGNIEVIQELLSQCLDVALKLTARDETALHLAVKNSQLEALQVLVQGIGKEKAIKLANIPDKEGNTVLQLAVKAEQVEALDFLAKDLQLKPEEVLNLEDQVWAEARGMVLVVASLIVTVTYTAGMTPPPTIWKEGMKLEAKCIFHPPKHVNFFTSSSYCPALAYFIFMSFNTAGFFASVFLIFFFRNITYVQVLLQISLSSMMVNYVTLSVAMSPNGISIIFIYLITIGIFVYCVLTFQVVRSYLHQIFVWASKRFGCVTQCLLPLFTTNTFCWPAGGSSHGGSTPTPASSHLKPNTTPGIPLVKGNKDPEA